MSFLHKEYISGPIQSRRLGLSLGVNLLPSDGKICNFNCIYCECGLNEAYRERSAIRENLPCQKDILEALEKYLQSPSCPKLDSITFSGNGEPSLHPDFDSIVKECCRLRDIYQSKTKLSIITNASTLDRKEVVEALKLADNKFLKLDAYSRESFGAINQAKDIEYESIVENLQKLDFEYSIQTLLFDFEGGQGGGSVACDSVGCFGELSREGKHGSGGGSASCDNGGGVVASVNGGCEPNCSQTSLDTFLEKIRKINPPKLILYGLDRESPSLGLRKLRAKELEQAAKYLEKNLQDRRTKVSFYY